MIFEAEKMQKVVRHGYLNSKGVGGKGIRGWGIHLFKMLCLLLIFFGNFTVAAVIQVAIVIRDPRVH